MKIGRREMESHNWIMDNGCKTMNFKYFLSFFREPTVSKTKEGGMRVRPQIKMGHKTMTFLSALL